MFERYIENVNEMLFDRGYDITSFGEKIIEDKIVTYMCYAQNHPNILVMFVSKKLNIELIRKYLDNLYQSETTHGIIVCKAQITPKGKNIIDVLNDIRDVKIELFDIESFVTNITKHRLVPKHTKLSDDEKQAITKQYGARLPDIFASDPVVKHYGFEVGDIIKIERKDGTIYYRQVTPVV